MVDFGGFLNEYINFWTSLDVGMAGGNSQSKDPNNMNGRVQSGYDVQKHPQWASVPLQDLDRHIRTYFTSLKFTWWGKALWKSRPVDISWGRQ